MPFTPAHPAAALPLGRLHPRIVPVALVVGSLMPDLPYMFLVGPAREVTHTFGATLWFCLPAGWVAYLIVRLLLLESWHALLPSAWRARVTRPAHGRNALTGVDPLGVTVGLWLGATTHAAWDAFTHWTSPVVQSWTALQEIVVAVGNQRLSVFNLLQHGSTVVGILILLIWATEWSMRGQQREATAPTGHRGRSALLVVVLLLPPLVAAGAMALRFRQHGITLLGFTTGATAAGFTLLPTLCFTAVAVGLAASFLPEPGAGR